MRVYYTLVVACRYINLFFPSQKNFAMVIGVEA